MAVNTPAFEIYTALTSALGAIPALAAPDGTKRIYPTAAPEGAGLPHIVYQQTRRESIDTLDGPTGCIEAEFRLDLAAKSYSEIVSLRAAAESAVRGMESLAGCISAEAAEIDGEGYAPGWDVVVRPIKASFICKS